MIKANGEKIAPALMEATLMSDPLVKGAMVVGKGEFPQIIVSSATLGVFPVTFPSRVRIDWLPLDKASHVLVDILISSSRAAPNGDESGTLVNHVVNPNAASWSTLAPDILRLYPERQGLRAVQYDE